MTDKEPKFPTETIAEGKVRVQVPKLSAYGVCPSDYAPSKAPVFFNPVMEFNRDLTILALRSYQQTIKKEISICEPLTATGIRGLRFATEISEVKTVICGDISDQSVELAAHNVELNNLQNRVIVKHKEANRLLGEHSAPRTRFDVIDIDPFGTPVPFLDAAVRAIRNNGLLAATATDMAPLCGVHVKACVRKYGGRPLRTEYCHELAVRLLAGQICLTAAKHDIGTQVLFSHCSDHYVRVYMNVRYGCNKADESLKQMGYLLHCYNCLHRESAAKPFPETEIKCSECGEKMDYAGPLWLGRIFDAHFVNLMIQENMRVAFRNSRRISKLLNLAREEANMSPTYYVLDKLSGKFGFPAPSVAAISEALHNRGFRAVETHFNPRGIRTDASSSVMQDIVRKVSEA